VSNALIVDWYDELGNGSDPVLFGHRVRARYSEGTLQRLVVHPDPRTREAAVAALRVVGSIASNEALAAALHDEVLQVQELAEAALWAIWFRADSENNNLELQRLARLIHDREYAKALAGLNTLIARAPLFAEAYNQRAILYWHWSEYKRSIADCEQVLRLNPLHFGAQAGLAQCYHLMRRPAEALRAFRKAQALHPGLVGVNESIRTLERMLRDQRKKEDKK
jgi:tetratricopeptide (TPR) repeat protein